MIRVATRPSAKKDQERIDPQPSRHRASPDSCSYSMSSSPSTTAPSPPPLLNTPTLLYSPASPASDRSPPQSCSPRSAKDPDDTPARRCCSPKRAGPGHPLLRTLPQRPVPLRREHPAPRECHVGEPTTREEVDLGHSRFKKLRADLVLGTTWRYLLAPGVLSDAALSIICNGP